MDRKELIRRSVGGGLSTSRIAMRLFILSPTAAFEGDEEEEFSIIEEISEFASVSVRSIHACGSAKLGFSPRKNTDFRKGESDLDVAIIDADFFTRMMDGMIVATNRYKDLSGFAQGSYSTFSKYLAKGIFRPDLMPECDLKRKWVGFFDDLSRRNQSRFDKVSAFVYLSDSAFRMKQSESMDEYAKEFL